jgi:hypothetical protein
MGRASDNEEEQKLNTGNDGLIMMIFEQQTMAQISYCLARMVYDSDTLRRFA